MTLQGILGQLSGGARSLGLGNVRAPARGQKPPTSDFKVTMIIGGDSVTFRDNVSLVNGDYNLVSYYTVRAQEEATFGWGDENHPDNQGYIYFQAQTSVPAAIDGPTRFALEDPRGLAVAGGLVLEEDSTRLDGSQTDRRLMVPLPRFAGVGNGGLPPGNPHEPHGHGHRGAGQLHGADSHHHTALRKGLAVARGLRFLAPLNGPTCGKCGGSLYKVRVLDGRGRVPGLPLLRACPTCYEELQAQTGGRR